MLEIHRNFLFNMVLGFAGPLNTFNKKNRALYLAKILGGVAEYFFSFNLTNGWVGKKLNFAERNPYVVSKRYLISHHPIPQCVRFFPYIHTLISILASERLIHSILFQGDTRVQFTENASLTVNRKFNC